MRNVLLGGVLAVGLGAAAAQDKPAAVPPPVTWVAVAQDKPAVLPPPKPADEPRKLRAELEALAAEREAAAKDLADGPPLAAERAKLRAQLLDLIKKVGEKKPPAPAVVMPPATVTPKAVEPAPKPKVVIDESFKPLDPLGYARSLYLAGDVEAALQAFHNIDPDTLPKESRLFVTYMSACYLRDQGKATEAAAQFREVANAKDDKFLAEYAISQLQMMKDRQELQTQLEQLRAGRKSK
jgi:cell division protein FtsB